ncbi:MAG: hypothetical protein JHD16_04680 [Solirubrobacteraceae bacterium]|nr:hypothetical protein [Solirubrobacteraceae bacterium]
MSRATQRLVVLGATGLAVLASAGVEAARGASPVLPPVPLAQEFNDLAVAADGSVRTLEVRPGSKTGARATIRRIDPAGAQLPPIVFYDPASDIGRMDGALTPDGGAVVFVTKGDFESEVVTAVNVSPTGQVSAPQPVAGPGTALSPYVPRIGPTGAVAAVMPVPGAVAFRPAGAGGFVAPLALVNFDVDGDIALEVAMAPDGGAAVLAYGEGTWLRPYVRRIDPDGRIGPKIDLGFGSVRSGIGGLEFARNGDLGVVLHHGPRKRVGARVLFTKLPAGAVQPTPVQPLPAALGGTVDRGFSFGLSAGQSEFAVLTGRGLDGLRLWTGSEELTLAATFRDVNPFSGDVVFGPGGVITTVWEDELGAGAFAGSRLVAARRLTDGTVTRPRQLMPRARGTSQSTYDIAPLPDGRLAVVYDQDPGPDDQLLGRVIQP